MTISDDRLRSPKYLAFLEKLTSHHWWTADDYAGIPDEVVVEIYDGSIHVVPSASPDHQSVVLDLATALRAVVPDRKLVLTDVDVRVLGKIYKPDVLVLAHRSEDLPLDGGLLQIVVEVISANENIERSGKMVAYAAQRIPLYIIIDGKSGRRHAEIYGLDEDAHSGYALRATIPADGRMEFSQPFPFALDMNQINS